MNLLLLFIKRNIISNKQIRRCLLIIAIVFSLSIFALVVSDSIINGMEERLIKLSSGHFSVDGDVSNRFSNNNVQYTVHKIIKGSILFYSNEIQKPLILKGAEELYFENNKNLLNIDNSFIQNGLIVSRFISEKYNLHIGDKVALMLLTNNESLAIRPEVSKIIGYYSTGYKEIDENICYSNYDYAYSLFPFNSSKTTELILNNNLETTYQSFVSEFSDLKLKSWKASNYEVYSNLLASKQCIYLILFIVIVVLAYFTMSVTQELIQDSIYDFSLFYLIGCNLISIKNLTRFSLIITFIISITAGFILGILFSFLAPIVLQYVLSFSSLSSLYLKNFEIIIPIANSLKLAFFLLIVSFFVIDINLFKVRKFKPIQLFNENC